MTFQILQGDCRKVMKTFADNTFDSMIVDVPYELGFMGKSWDSTGIAYEVGMWREGLRVIKPGGYLLAFSSARTYHRMTCAIEDAGFEVRDNIARFYTGDDDTDAFLRTLNEEQQEAFLKAFGRPSTLEWVYGSGFPKSLDVSKAIDKAAGVGREVLGVDPVRFARLKNQISGSVSTGEQWEHGGRDVTITAPATEAARQWQGWGTALKPAHEPICVARKPLIGTVAENVLAHGTGGLNIDACRVSPVSDADADADADAKGYVEKCASVVGLDSARTKNTYAVGDGKPREDSYSALGRFPANVIHDGSDEVVSMFPDSDGAGGSLPNVKITGYGSGIGNGESAYLGGERAPFDSGTGSAARFFYCAKASASERSAGLDSFVGRVTGDGRNAPTDNPFLRNVSSRKNHHPTVKPIALARYLCRLVTPPGGKILDQFAGSGSIPVAAILEGFDVTAIELDRDGDGNPLGYIDIITARCLHAEAQYAEETAQMRMFG